MPGIHRHNLPTESACQDAAIGKVLKNQYFFQGPDWHGMCLFYRVVEQSVALQAGKTGLVSGKTHGSKLGYIA